MYRDLPGKTLESHDETSDDEISKSRKLELEYSRFANFASVEFGEECFMTPRDFLDSVIQDRPRPRLKRKVFTEKDVAR